MTKLDKIEQDIADIKEQLDKICEFFRIGKQAPASVMVLKARAGNIVDNIRNRTGDGNVNTGNIN